MGLGGLWLGFDVRITRGYGYVVRIRVMEIWCWGYGLGLRLGLRVIELFGLGFSDFEVLGFKASGFRLSRLAIESQLNDLRL